MDSDQGKLFIGGISWNTSEETLSEYFGKYGEVSQTVIMRDKITGRPRGFGFVVFADPSILDRVLQDNHTLDGRTVEAKRALTRDEQHNSSRSGNSNAGRSFGSGDSLKTKKIFVGGLPPTLTEEGFCQYFETYGHVTDVVVMYDQNTRRPRGFGFISFDTEEAVDQVLHKTFHELNGKLVEVKRALPKDANPGSGGRSVGSGNYQGHGASGASAGTYDGRTDTNRYMQPQATGGGFVAYNSSVYGTPSYGYGSNNNVGYGGYGGPNAAGYNGPNEAYGNPNALNAGYISGPPSAPRSQWNTQAPAYGSAAYGANAAYGTAAPWNAGVGSTAAAPTGHSLSGAASHGNQGYGYGVYGGSEGSYPNPGSYGVGGRTGSAPASNTAGGADGGEQQMTGAGYMVSGYGDANGNSGYSNTVWRSDPSQAGSYGTSQANGPQGGQVGYVGGYNGGQARQAQQQ